MSARALSAFRIPEQWCWSQARFGWGARTKFLRNTRTLSAPQMGRDRFALSGFRLPSFRRHHGRESQALSGLRFPTTHLRQDVENDTTCHRFPLSSFRRPSSRGAEKMEEHFRFPASADPPRGAQRKWRSISAFRLPPTLLEGRREMEGHVASLSGDRFSEITFRRRGVKQWCEIPPGIQYSPSLLHVVTKLSAER